MSPVIAPSTRPLANSGHIASVADARSFAPNGATRRQLGAFYTPRSAADYMADWVVRKNGEFVLEPSYGNGIFLHALASSASRQGFHELRLIGVEIDEESHARALRETSIPGQHLHLADFLSLPPALPK